MKTTSASLLLLVMLAAFVPSEQTDDDQQQLIGRPDGHEPYDRPLIGRPDGHELHTEDSSSESSEEHVPEGDDSSDEDPEKPLIRCKRPICAMYCEFGFKKDAIGCPICECLDAAESSLIGRPDGHEARPSCAGRPMCRMYCEFGFKRDADGCEFCSCISDPCRDVSCGPGLQCKPLPCDDLRSCTKKPAKCVEMRATGTRTRPRCRGPQPMCASFCPNGYKYKPDGCMTCDCAEETLPDNCMGSSPCEEGLMCRNRTVNGATKPMCTVKTLCETEREKPVALGSGRVECEPDGSYKPLQCTATDSVCWCVDGLGHEVPNTRTSVYIGKHKPNCVRNVTLSMHIHMLMVVEHHIDITKLDSLHSLIVDHVSSWLVIEPHYVTVVKTEAKKSEDIEGEARIVVVEVVVVHDGVTDLPSASEHMKRRMHQGRCRIPVEGGGSLKPDPHSVNVQHKFAAYHTTTPLLIVYYNYPEGVYRNRAVWRLALCAVTAIALVFIIIAVTSAIVQRRRNRLAAQFRHQKLPSPTISEKDLLANDYIAEPVVVATEDVVKEKEPIA